MKPDILYIYRTADCWMVSWQASREADHIRDLFGGTELPTAWTAQASESDVRAGLLACNPSKLVILQEHGS